jgi:hypothetical protein
MTLLDETLEGAKTAAGIVGFWLILAAEAAFGLLILALIVRLLRLILR